MQDSLIDELTEKELTIRKPEADILKFTKQLSAFYLNAAQQLNLL